MKTFVFVFALFTTVYSEARFYSYTRQNPVNSTEVFKNDISGSFLTPSRLTKFVVHGFTDTANADWMIRAKDEFLAFADYNVILVGWTALSATDERAAHDLADFYTYLVSQGFDASTLHCSGHSAGAHVCGFSGKFFTTATSLKLSRISGLDAAKVDQYNVSDPSSRLDIGDADVVDCIHTDGGGSGLLANICKIDFYPNGGTRTQPGCTGVIELSGICSHVRAYVYFVESIGTDQFYSWACDSWDNFLAGACNGNTMISYGPSYMPLDVPAGTYGLKTNSETPFACGNNCP